MSQIAHQFTTTVLPGNHIELPGPPLPEGATVVVRVVTVQPPPFTRKR